MTSNKPQVPNRYISNTLYKTTFPELRHQLMTDKYPVPHGLDKEVYERRLAETKGPNIRPTVKVVMFWLGESVTKEHKIVPWKIRLGEELTQTEQNAEEGQNIEVPEIVDINYSDIKNVSTSKYGGKLNPYKDGILIVSEDNPHQYHTLEIRDHVADANGEDYLNSHFLSSVGLNQSTHWAMKKDLSFLEKLKDKLKLLVDFKKIKQFSVEIDPRRVDEHRLLFYADEGVNKISFGIQDFDVNVQNKINRLQPSSIIHKLLTNNVRKRFKSINFDLLIGLPAQTIESMRSTINEVISRVVLTYPKDSVTVIVQFEKVPSLKDTKVIVLFPLVADVVPDEQEPP